MVKKQVVTPSLERTSNEGYVEVMFAKSLDEATGCRSYLEELRIPAMVEHMRRGRSALGVAVLVPEERLIEASEFLAARDQDEEEEYDDDYDDEEFDEEFDDDDDYEEDDDYVDDEDEDEEEEDIENDEEDEEYEDDYEEGDDV